MSDNSNGYYDDPDDDNDDDDDVLLLLLMLMMMMVVVVLAAMMMIMMKLMMVMMIDDDNDKDPFWSVLYYRNIYTANMSGINRFFWISKTRTKKAHYRIWILNLGPIEYRTPLRGEVKDTIVDKDRKLRKGIMGFWLTERPVLRNMNEPRM